MNEPRIASEVRDARFLLSIVVPAFNEAHRIRNTLVRIGHWLQAVNMSSSAEVIVVDDGSTDNTAECVKQVTSRSPWVHLLQLPINTGKGAAVRTGVERANGDYILFTDVDLSTPIDEATKLLAFLQQGYDIAIASRRLPESHIEKRQPWYRIPMSWVFSTCVKRLVCQQFSDTQCGFKMFTRRSAKCIFAQQCLDGFCFDVEVLQIALGYGYSIREVPVVWSDSPGSSVKPFRDAIRMLVDLIRISCKHRGIQCVSQSAKPGLLCNGIAQAPEAEPRHRTDGKPSPSR